MVVEKATTSTSSRASSSRLPPAPMTLGTSTRFLLLATRVPRPENAIALRIRLLQADPMDKFEDLVPEERACRERPPSCHAAGERDERAPLHSITSSASASSLGGISRPSALAATTLMTSSYLVGISTGKSPGFVPLRMRATYCTPARR